MCKGNVHTDYVVVQSRELIKTLLVVEKNNK